jgi:hypothetical protein
MGLRWPEVFKSIGEAQVNAMARWSGALVMPLDLITSKWCDSTGTEWLTCHHNHMDRALGHLRSCKHAKLTTTLFGVVIFLFICIIIISSAPKYNLVYLLSRFSLSLSVFCSHLGTGSLDPGKSFYTFFEGSTRPSFMDC